MTSDGPHIQKRHRAAVRLASGELRGPLELGPLLCETGMSGAAHLSAFSPVKIPALSACAARSSGAATPLRVNECDSLNSTDLAAAPRGQERCRATWKQKAASVGEAGKVGGTGTALESDGPRFLGSSGCGGWMPLGKTPTLCLAFPLFLVQDSSIYPAGEAVGPRGTGKAHHTVSGAHQKGTGKWELPP